MKFSPGFKKIIVRLMAVATIMLIEVSCGDTYRPIVLPVNPNPPDPESLHFAMVLSDNGTENQGTSSRIDVSGDTNMGNARVGIGPVHATILPNMSLIYVVNKGQDVISSYPTGTATTVTTISLPAGASPSYVHTTETASVYVANSGNNTVSVISASTNVITNTIPVGSNPVALLETPDSKKVYVANEGSNTVSSINVIDKTTNAPIGVGSSPTLIASRTDSARIYVLNQGSGTISVINTADDTVMATLPVPGANFMFYDRSLNRIYVTLNTSKQLAIFNASVDPPSPMIPVDLSAACGAGCTLDGVAALPNGTKAYVSSHEITGTCSHLDGVPDEDPPCVITRLSSIKVPLNILTSTITTQRKIVVNAQTLGFKQDVSKVDFCDTARFRRYIVSSGDSSRIFVANCDAGGTDIIRTSDDTFVLNLTAPLHSSGVPGDLDVFLPQNPVFLVPGR